MVLSTFERQTICTLIHGRVCFVGTYCDAVQGTVILRSGMVRALLYRTFDAFIDVVHVR